MTPPSIALTITPRGHPTNSYRRKTMIFHWSHVRDWSIGFAEKDETIPRKVSECSKMSENKRKQKYLDLTRQLKKAEPVMKMAVIPTVIGIVTGRKTREIGIQRKTRDLPDYRLEISQNTEKSPGDERRLGVIQTPVSDHKLTLMWKTLKRV